MKGHKEIEDLVKKLKGDCTEILEALNKKLDSQPASRSEKGTEAYNFSVTE